MSLEITKQTKYWDKKVEDFDSIYSHKKGKVENFLDSLFRWDIYKRFEFTLENAEPIQGKTFLDVGCGTGRYSLELARRDARLVVGLDISSNMVRACELRAMDERLKDNTRFVHTDLLGYAPSEKFDVCIGMGLFDYIKDPVPVLRKMREVTQDRAILSFPRLWTWRAPVRKIRLSLKKCDVYFFTKEDVEDLLKKAGFKSYKISVIGQLFCAAAYSE